MPRGRKDLEGAPTRLWYMGQGFITALSLAGACAGSAEISIGTIVPSSPDTFFLSPTGVDQGPTSTRDQPWKTFRYALPRLVQGSTLILLDGEYNGNSTGYLNITCDPTGAGPV